MQVHGRSSGKLNLVASWHEPRDVPAEEKPRYFRPNPHRKPPRPGKSLLMIDDWVTSRTHLYETLLTYQQTEVTLDTQHEFDDIKFRHVSYARRSVHRFNYDSLEAFKTDLHQISRVVFADIIFLRF